MKTVKEYLKDLIQLYWTALYWVQESDLLKHESTDDENKFIIHKNLKIASFVISGR